MFPPPGNSSDQSESCTITQRTFVLAYSPAAVVLLDDSASARGAVYQVVDIVYTQIQEDNEC